MRRIKFKQQFDGEWIKPRRRGYLMKCCDCGLVHRFNFKVINGVIVFQAFRQKR